MVWQKLIGTVRGVGIYPTHIAPCMGDGLSRLTQKSLAHLKAIIYKWGEAQMPARGAKLGVKHPVAPCAPLAPPQDLNASNDLLPGGSSTNASATDVNTSGTA